APRWWGGVEYRTRWRPRAGIEATTSRADRPSCGGRRASTRRNEVWAGDWFSISSSTCTRWPGCPRAAEGRRRVRKRCRLQRANRAAANGSRTTPTEIMCSVGDPSMRAATHRATPAPKTRTPRPEGMSGLPGDGDRHFGGEVLQHSLRAGTPHDGVRRHDHAVREHRRHERLHVVGDHVVAFVGGRERARGAQQHDRGPRAGTQVDVRVTTRPLDEVDDVTTDGGGDRPLPPPLDHLPPRKRAG